MSLSASCSTLTLLNGNITYNRGSSPIAVGTVATHSCDNRFVPSRDGTRTCTDSGAGGVWSGSPLTCLSELHYATSNL